MKSPRKSNTKLQFLYEQSEYLTKQPCNLLCNSLIQKRFHCACVSWYPIISQNMKKIEFYQNKCICFCLKLSSRQHIGATEFKEINWLPTKQRVEERVLQSL